MRQSEQHHSDAPRRWWQDLNVREALSAFGKAVRAARRYPAGSPVREASTLEFAHAVRKALLHGPLVMRLGPGGPTLPGDRTAPPRVPDDAPIDLVLRDADLDALRGIVDRWVGQPLRSDAHGAGSGGPVPRAEG